MGDLFSSPSLLNRNVPLAAEIRPSSLDEIIGQQHLLASGKPLRRKVDSGRIGTVILFGPSGVGKTTIARAIGAHMNSEFRFIHPANDKVAEIKAIEQDAKRNNKRILLFVDEIHRYNSAQQDHLLDLTEHGVLDFIGATSLNPYHNLTSAIVSRAVIYTLNPISVDDMEAVIRRAIREVMARKNMRIVIAPDVIRSLAGRSSGDARRAINTLESIIIGQSEETSFVITQELVDEAYNSSPVPYDRNGDGHYDTASAFIKSMRGSDPDGTLYYLARLIHSGEDPRYIARRIMIHASEDVGLADNSALATATAAHQAVSSVGYPEARIILAHAALHVALAPKSNSAYRGIAAALNYVEKNGVSPIPKHLRDTHYAGAASLGNVGYKFPHDYPDGWVDQVYAPGIEEGKFYQSDARDNRNFERNALDFWSSIKKRLLPRRF